MRRLTLHTREPPLSPSVLTLCLLHPPCGMYLYCYLNHVGVLGYQGGTLDAVVEHVNLKVLGLNEVDIQVWASDAE